ncbi:Response regulator receiver domain-containing protein [Granulicella rosea]|uniref:histidine kinase n=1 Tax=Granulicella rosea TaxID=474952 RepID=A0A239DWK1_9BACT|nr:response regulator [Granulicella rosea]SNS36639.1 Response regulator receiver domain-containing protein [Granulicella rosea]
MHIVIIFGYLILSAAAGALLSLYLMARRTIDHLRAQLVTAKEAQQTQNSLLLQRSELDGIKDEFISTVSHELRTPLTSIRGALGLLSAGLLGAMDPKAQNLLRIAVTNTDRLIRLINDILDLERMESGRAPLHIRRCSLRELVLQALETMQAMGDAAGVRLEPVLMSSPDTIFFDGDPDRILQVLTNLLSNAIKFSPSGALVQISFEGNAQTVRLRVSDQGRGIPLNKLDTIFDRFQQVEAADARQKGGTGLGLAICRTIVNQHGGRIWALANETAGASLCMELPRNSRPLESSAVPHTTITTPAGDATVLICDDDPGIRAVVSEHLLRQGYQILEAESGERAIQLAHEHEVEAILLDLYMPGLSGWETLQRLKHSPATASIPVVILSVLPPATPPPGLHTNGAKPAAPRPEGWVQKPFNENLLLAELSRVLHTGDGPAYVLLVEDDVDLAAVVVAGFEDANVQIDHARTRQQAIEHCMLSRPDLIILDLKLPDGDGFSLVNWLRQQPDLRTLPLVVYSGREVSDSEMSALRLGPTQFLTKATVQPKEVEELVMTIVQRLRHPAPAVTTP